ncbi:acetoacetate--CoA ligase [Mumia zhuanghuii]|uniref:Acetoacetate--CoA ligase n=1 Tax=Mumia zhuanghuii TaxID=2585211 RepID=A0A5C4MJZ6_9ACTN|nr:acetoacetate--CoA ligase [Mumia zhuanghuii]TNC45948.1 acetoacetate--CoA ligase [Mumia zhuanghuii]TNC49703.1 acetoacetate--CoA ligase [Mumia zhuanghuii]
MPTPKVAHEILWEPAQDARRTTRIGDFMDWVGAHGGPVLDDVRALHAWSVEDVDAFWLAVWQYFDVPGDAAGSAPDVALVPVGEGEPAMPGRTWFPGVTLNYAEAMLRMPGRADDDVVVVSRSQSRDDVTYTAAELRDAVARARTGLVRLGVGSGDRVVAYAPNVPETLVLLLAAASLGAVFSSCAPEFGTRSVIDRWGQIEPTVMLAVDGYRYGTKAVDRREEVAAIEAALPSLRATVRLPYLDDTEPAEGLSWADLLAEPGELAFERVAFDHPLYLLFSSGTTGLPKPIVHGHGGITLEHTKSIALELGLGPDDVFFWFSTTGWMMWNLLVSGLLAGSTVVMYDGNLAYPDLGSLWRMSEELGITYFGTSAPFLLQCRKEGLVPKDVADLSALRGVGSTGAPLPVEGFRWVYDAVSPTVRLGSLSGGTDVCTGFVGANPLLPVYAGEISGPCLGVAIAAYDLAGKPVIDELGELVITEPMPSMPVGFWGDDDGSRYRAAYFEDFPGVWRHGDWITIRPDGSCTITGRSDATLNRGGVRLGTAEFYSVVEGLDEVTDSLVIHLEDTEGGAGELLLFVVLAEGLELDETVRRTIAGALRTQLSPRHVPDIIHQVPGVPRTLSGKKLEVPVKKILRGAAIDDAAARGALQNPETLEAYEGLRGDA